MQPQSIGAFRDSRSRKSESDLIDYRRQRIAQNGEDGVIARIFEVVGPGNKFCCEFGAWDGIFLSNTRSLILEGWSALLIEGDAERFRELQKNYANDAAVVVDCAFVDAADNSLARILERKGLAERRIDFLSIDVDGADFQHFSSLDRLRSLPRLVVVEVQPEHGPHRLDMVPNDIANRNIGQPLAIFTRRARELGYRLVCYLGCNAFFLQEEVGGYEMLPTLSPEEAWTQCMRLHKERVTHTEYFFRRNHGMADSLYRFDNPVLTAEYLGIAPERAAGILRKGRRWRVKRLIKHALFGRPY
jgi:hypothetical protein